MSACATIPQHAPFSSTTAIRRIRLPSIKLQHSSTVVSGVTVTALTVIASEAVRSRGLRPSATVRIVISLSVIIPTGFLLSSLSTTGMHPQSLSIIILATSCSEVFAVQHAGSAVITSWTNISDFSLSIETASWCVNGLLLDWIRTEIEQMFDSNSYGCKECSTWSVAQQTGTGFLSKHGHASGGTPHARQ